MTAVREVDVLVIGAGPAGLSAARQLAEDGIETLVVEREDTAGGIPRHCFHPGYGLRDLRTMTTGPKYADLLVARALDAGAEIATSTMVTDWTSDDAPHVRTTSSRGVEEIRARAVLLATGTRERPRPARLVPGDRPSGVWTTGALQQAVHLHHQEVGRRAVIVGAELVSYSAVMTLREAGCEVVAMVTEQPRPDTYRVAQVVAGAAFKVPLLTRTRVTGVFGRPGVQAVEITHEDGRVGRLECDAVVFTADWIPDHELARAAGIPLDPASKAPTVDTALATSRPGVFAAGNLVHPAETADLCALGGRHAATSVAAFLRGEEASGHGVPTRVEGALGWVSPQVLRLDRPPARGEFRLTSAAVAARAHIEVVQDGRVLHRARVRGGLLPGRPVHVASTWLADVDPAGGHVVFRSAP